MIIAGLHCAHILFYNRVLDELSEHDLRALPHRPNGRSRKPLRAVPDRPPGHAVALPVAAGQRAPAADRRPGGRQRRAPERQPVLQPAARGCVHADRVRRRRLPVRAQHGPPLLPGELHQRHRRQHEPDRRPVLRASVRRRPSASSAARSATTATTCSAASPPPGATSAGRPSSTSATGRSRTTRRSTPRSRACCSRCPSRRSRRTPRPARPCCRSATCCASSPGRCPPGQAIARAMRVTALSVSRPVRHRQRLRAIRDQHPALVLHPRRS